MEFNARLLVDTQDPEIAYKILRAALALVNGAVEIKIQDTWLRNNEPLPADCAQRIALAWQKNRAIQSGVEFQTHDPAVMAELNQVDWIIEGHVAFVPVTGEVL